MSYKIFQLGDVITENIKCSHVINYIDNKLIPINYSYNDSLVPFLVQVPSLLFNSDDLFDEKKQLLTLPIKTKHDKKNEIVTKFFMLIDTFILNELKNNKKKWLSSDQKKVTYNAIINTINNNTTSAVILPLVNSTKIFNQSKEVIVPEINTEQDVHKKISFIKGSYISTILQIFSINITGSNITVHLIPHQLRISFAFPKQIKLIEYSFDESDNESDNEFDNNHYFDRIMTLKKYNKLSDKFDHENNLNKKSNDPKQINNKSNSIKPIDNVLNNRLNYQSNNESDNESNNGSNDESNDESDNESDNGSNDESNDESDNESDNGSNDESNDELDNKSNDESDNRSKSESNDDESSN
jgi:hypothetical protein